MPTHYSQKIKSHIAFYASVIFVMMSCNSSQNPQNTATETSLAASPPLFTMEQFAAGNNIFRFHVQPPIGLNFKKPALQACATATYNDYWIFIGGRKGGFHGLDNAPPPFRTVVANDSIWVIDYIHQTSTGVPVPAVYAKYLAATNTQYYQVGNYLYMCGGFTIADSSVQNFNWTSDRFFEINIPNLLAYVNSGGTTPALNQVFTKVIQSPFVQVTGGEMLVVNNNYYLVCGQNYSGFYASGNTGAYTNAIRKFNVTNVSGNWSITDTLSVIDTVNLHRRDLNVVPVIAYGPDSIRAMIYGGVFTPQGLGYRNPVFISGLANGTPAITVDTLQQRVNQYDCARAKLAYKNSGFEFNITALLGGISLMEYDTATQQLVTGDNGIPMPFSKIISYMFTDGNEICYEFIQLPPYDPFMPGYLGSDAFFKPLPQYIMAGTNDIIDMAKVFPASGEILIGYMYGGIVSPQASTFSMTKSIQTNANSFVYPVYIEIPAFQ